MKFSSWGFPLENPAAERLNELMRRQNAAAMERRRRWERLRAVIQEKDPVLREQKWEALRRPLQTNPNLSN